MKVEFAPTLIGFALALTLLSASPGALAAEVWEEHHLLIESRQEVGTLGPDLFGEQVSFYSGGASFSTTDVELPGNNALPVALTRMFVSPGDGDYKSNGAFGDWSIDLPHVGGIFAEATGWVSSVGRRCSVTSSIEARPPDVELGTTPFSAAEYWRGIELNIPGVSTQSLALVGASTAQKPASGTWYWVNNDWVYVGCLPSVLNEPGGEGFLARTPDGTRYWFNWMAVADVRPTTKTITDHGGGPNGRPVLNRKRYALYATRVEDRFGNRVDYTYTNASNEKVRLTRIQSSDGRVIDISYNAAGRVSAVNAHGRTWNYAYTGDRLTLVTLPDSATWQIDFSDFERAGVSNLYEIAYNEWWIRRESGPSYRTCEMPPEFHPDVEWTGTITHPSGAVGSFSFAPVLLGRTNVRRVCECSGQEGTNPGCGWGGGPGSNINYEYSALPYQWHTIALTRKRITGPGLEPAEWSYAYHSDTGWDFENIHGYTTTTVHGPDDELVRYVFGNSAGTTEGLLIRQETGSVSAGVLRSEVTDYALDAASQPFPEQVGFRVTEGDFTAISLRPARATTLSEGGSTFNMQVNGFDALARPVDVTRWSSGSLGTSRRDITEYHDHFGHWLLGLTRRVTNHDTGLEMTSIEYDSALAVPLRTYDFGALRHVLSYRSDGTVSRIQDALGRNTHLNQWKRGIPQQVVFHDGSSRSAVVNDRGEITSFTDEAGHTHHYQYDPMGRMRQITYPTGGDVSWHPTTLEFARSATGEFGIAAGHWRQTVSRGGYRKVRYFDAMWRPLLEQEYDTANVAATRRMRAWTYDHKGRVTFEAYPRASASSLSSFVHGVRNEYDALGRTVRIDQDIEGGEVARTVIDHLHNALGPYRRVRDPNGNTTATWYQSFDAPDEESPIRIDHPEGVRTLIERDVFGKPTAITRSGSFDGSAQSVARRYVYDTHQRLCKQIEPETGSTVLAYDAVGNLLWSAGGMALPSLASCNHGNVPAAARVQRAYDARNRILTLSFPDGLGDQTWDYTADGLVQQVSTANAAGEVAVNAYEYNNRRLLTRESLGLVGGAARDIHYRYDSHGHPERIIQPTGLQIAFAPNALGQPSQAGTYATGVQYHPNGAVKQFTYGNGIVHTLQQNLRGLPHRRRDSGAGTTALDDNYVYDHAGNVAAILDGLPGGRGDRVMSYDGLHRLTGTVSPMFGEAVYRYDALDNLRQVQVGGLSARDHTYHYNGRQQLDRIARTDNGVTVSTLDYDPQGNLSQRDGVQFDFDFGNRLRSAIGLETYLYDGHGRRVLARHATQGDIHSFYGQDGVLRYQRDDRAGAVTDFVYLAGSMVARVRSPLPPAEPVLTAPGTNLTGSYGIDWAAVPLATAYRVEERVDGGSWSQIHAGAATSVSVSGRSTGIHEYRGRACNGSACSAYSATATVQVTRAPTAAPGLTAPGTNTTGSYAVSWTTVTDGATYQLQERFNGGTWSNIQNTAATSRSLSGKAAGDWGYRVRACNPAGCGGWSATATTQVVHPPSSAPTVSAPSTNNTGSFSVAWGGVATATRYELQERLNSGSWSLVQNTGATSRAVSGKGNGTWRYRARACNIAGCSSYSPVVDVVVTLPPSSAPSLSTSTASYGQITASWGSVATATTY
ncbi:MAG: RHS repeat protein, partial [Lysobacteraceae bacterium]